MSFFRVRWTTFPRDIFGSEYEIDYFLVGDSRVALQDKTTFLHEFVVSESKIHYLLVKDCQRNSEINYFLTRTFSAFHFANIKYFVANRKWQQSATIAVLNRRSHVTAVYRKFSLTHAAQVW